MSIWPVLQAVDALGNVFAPVSPESAALVQALTKLGRIALAANPDDPVAVVEVAALVAEKAAADAKFGKG